MFFDLQKAPPRNPAPGQSALGAARRFRKWEQRARLLDAVVEVVTERGYEAASIRKVVLAAGLGRSTFYKLFADEEECLLAAFEEASEPIVAEVAEAAAKEEGFEAQVRAGLGALLEALAADPTLARVATIEIRAAGRACRESYQRVLERLAEEIVKAGGDLDRTPETARMAVGGAAMAIAREVGAGRSEQLPALLPDLLFMVLLPYVGPQKAAEEAMRNCMGEAVLAAGGESEWSDGKRWGSARAEPPATAKGVTRMSANRSEAAVERLVEEICAAAPAELEFPRRVRAAMRALLAALAGERSLAMAVAELRGEGAPDYLPYREALARFTGLLEEAASELEASIPLPHDTARGVIGGLEMVIAREVDEGRSEKLLSLLGDLVFLALMPYVGPEVAAEEMRRCREETKREAEL